MAEKTQAASSPAEVLQHLEAARKVVLSDSHFYSKIVHVILSIVGPAASVEVRRWGADFLAETFASPALTETQREELCTDVLVFLHQFLESHTEDPLAVRSMIQSAASCYAMLFRTMCVFHAMNCL